MNSGGCTGRKWTRPRGHTHLLSLVGERRLGACHACLLSRLRGASHGRGGEATASKAACSCATPTDTFIQKTKKLYLDTRTQRNLSKLNEDLQEVHSIMTRNIQEVLGQGEKLDSEWGAQHPAPAVRGLACLFSVYGWGGKAERAQPLPGVPMGCKQLHGCPVHADRQHVASVTLHTCT